MAPLTRRRAKSLGNTVETSDAPIENPVSSRGKRKSTENDNDNYDEDSAPVSPEVGSPKRQKLAMRTREDESTGSGRKTRLQVEIPTSSTPGRSKNKVVPDSQETGKGGTEPDDDVEPSSASKQLEEEASQRLASQSLEPEPTAAPKPKGKHLVFDNDDDVEKFVATATAEAEKKAEANQSKDEAGGSDDDDEAPEAVSTQAAAKAVQKAAQEASEAAEKQAASLKRKRQEKDSLYKQQAERRKRARGTVEIHQAQRADKGHASSEDGNANDAFGIAEVETAVSTGRQRTQRFKLPAVLPAEFLTDSSSEGEDDEDALRKRDKGNKKRKVAGEEGAEPRSKKVIALDAEAKPKRPRDRVVGATRFRVLPEQGDPQLAPRASRDARASKESLLRRRRKAGAASGRERERQGGVLGGAARGFFVKR